MRALTRRQQNLLEIETAEIRHAWAKAEVERGGATPTLSKYVEESLDEWRALKATLRERAKAAKILIST